MVTVDYACRRSARTPLASFSNASMDLWRSIMRRRGSSWLVAGDSSTLYRTCSPTLTGSGCRYLLWRCIDGRKIKCLLFVPSTLFECKDPGGRSRACFLGVMGWDVNFQQHKRLGTENNAVPTGCKASRSPANSIHILFLNVCFDISYPTLDFGSPRFPEMYGIGSLATSSHRPPMIGHGRATPFLELHTEVRHRKAGVGGKNKTNARSVPDHL